MSILDFPLFILSLCEIASKCDIRTMYTFTKALVWFAKFPASYFCSNCNAMVNRKATIIYTPNLTKRRAQIPGERLRSNTGAQTGMNLHHRQSIELCFHKHPSGYTTLADS